jgi:hypothetical protein
MKTAMALLALLGLSTAGCSSYRYAYAPHDRHPASTPVARVERHDIPEESPHAAVEVSSMGVWGDARRTDAAPTLHVRLKVKNDAGSPPVTVLASETRVDAGEELAPESLSGSELKGEIVVAGGAERVIDLGFRLDDHDRAHDLEAFTVRWAVETHRGVERGETAFGRVSAAHRHSTPPFGVGHGTPRGHGLGTWYGPGIVWPSRGLPAWQARPPIPGPGGRPYFPAHPFHD